MQTAEAKQRLKHAVDTVSVDEVPILKKSFAKACIQHGLQPMADAFHLTPVTLIALGADREVQQALLSRELPQTKVKRVLEQPQLKHILTLGHNQNGDDTVQLHFAKFIPQPSLHIRCLLPSEAWLLLPNGVVTVAGDFPSSPNSSDTAFDDLNSQASSSVTAYKDLQSEPVQSMLQLLPVPVRVAAEAAMTRAHQFDSSRHLHLRQLTDIVADVGRPVRLRFSHSVFHDTKEDNLSISMDMQHALQALQDAHGGRHDVFKYNNRMGVSGTLHRISALKNHQNDLCGLTYRVGRHLPGVADAIMDVVLKVARGGGEAGSLLLLGPPGVGKTTLLRDITRQLADEFHKIVMVVDTSEEIAGGGDMPHACIGGARRMLGTVHQSKYEVLEEAVANHGPEVLVVDEIGNAKEVAAIKDIAQRGVAMVATVHGNTLQHLLENPVLSPLVGGKQRMVIGDMAAMSHNGRKTRSERCETPTFSTVVEIRDRNTWHVHQDVAASVDKILNGEAPATHIVDSMQHN